MPITSEAQMPARYSVGRTSASPAAQGSGLWNTEIRQTEMKAMPARISVLPRLSVAAAITTGRQEHQREGIHDPAGQIEQRRELQHVEAEIARRSAVGEPVARRIAQGEHDIDDHAGRDRAGALQKRQRIAEAEIDDEQRRRLASPPPSSAGWTACAAAPARAPPRRASR